MANDDSKEDRKLQAIIAEFNVDVQIYLAFILGLLAGAITLLATSTQFGTPISWIMDAVAIVLAAPVFSLFCLSLPFIIMI